MVRVCGVWEKEKEVSLIPSSVGRRSSFVVAEEKGACLPAALDFSSSCTSARPSQRPPIDLAHFADVSRDARPAAARGEGPDVDAPPPLSPDGEEGDELGSILPAAATLRWPATAGVVVAAVDARRRASAGRAAGAARAREPRPSAFMSKAIRRGARGARESSGDGSARGVDFHKSRSLEVLNKSAESLKNQKNPGEEKKTICSPPLSFFPRPPSFFRQRGSRSPQRRLSFFFFSIRFNVVFLTKKKNTEKNKTHFPLSPNKKKKKKQSPSLSAAPLSLNIRHVLEVEEVVAGAGLLLCNNVVV